MRRERVPAAVRSLALVAVLCTSLLLVTSAQAEVITVQLNPPLPDGRYAYASTISPDSEWVVYKSDLQVDDMYELYSVPIGGGPSVKLNGPITEGGYIRQIRVSPDSSRVVYIADAVTVGIDELYSVPIGGGGPVKIASPSVTGPGVLGFRISPDSTRVVYAGKMETAGTEELYSVPISGGAAVKLSPDLAENGYVWSFSITDNGERVVFLADQSHEFVADIFSVQIGGEGLTKLTPVGRDVLWGGYSFKLTPDSSTVVYADFHYGEPDGHLYAVPITGGTRVELSDAFAEQDLGAPFWLSHDGSTVVFSGDIDPNLSGELYSVPITGGTPALLDDSVRYYCHDHEAVVLTPDGSRAVYVTYDATNQTRDLYSVSVAGGTPVRLSQTAIPHTGPRCEDFEVSSDGETAVYESDQDTEGVRELYSVPIAGGTPEKLNLPLLHGDVEKGWAISPDAEYVVYAARADLPETTELYRVPVNGGTSEKLNPPMSALDYVNGILVSPDSNSVVYSVRDASVNVRDLWSTYWGYPDLQISYSAPLSFAPFDVGETVDWAVHTHNAGNSTAGASHTAFYLGTSCDTPTRLIDTEDIDALSAGEKSYDSQPVTFVPADAGTRYLIAVADHLDAVTDEIDEDNNTRCYGPFTVNPCYELNVTIAPLGAGHILQTPGANCGSSRYTEGTHVSLLAIDNTGYAFDQWSGDVVSTSTSIGIDMDDDYDVTAEFSSLSLGPDLVPSNHSISSSAPYHPGQQFDWHITTQNVGVMTASESRVGYYLGTSCTDLSNRVADDYVPALSQYNWHDDITTYTFQPADLGSRYLIAVVDWQDDVNEKCETNNADCIGPLDITDCFSLSTSVNPSASGSISVDPPPDCGDEYNSLTTLTVTAEPAEGYLFDHWGGGLSGSNNPETLNLGDDTSVTAYFVEEPLPCYDLKLSVVPPGSGLIYADPTPNCGSQYTAGTEVTMAAFTTPDYTFSRWAGHINSTDNPLTVTVNRYLDQTAVFYIKTRVFLPMVLKP